MNNAYEKEARERWGNTPAYAEYTKKAPSEAAVKSLEAVFAEFAGAMQGGCTPESAQAQALVLKLQRCITEGFYTCTPEILAGLGKMYIGDVRFKANLDRHAPGTAQFVSLAIEVFTESAV